MQPILRIIVVVIITFILCLIIYIPINRGDQEYNANTYSRFDEILNRNTNYDVLFLGASKNYRNIYPRIIDSICGTDSYIVGYDGAKLQELDLLFSGYMVHHPAPKVLVLTLDWLTFTRSEVYWGYPQFYLFLNNDTIYRRLVANVGFKIRMIKALPFLRMTSIDDYTKYYALKRFIHAAPAIPDNEIRYKGFISNGNLTIHQNETYRLVGRGPQPIADVSLKSLNNIITMCNRYHTKLIWIFPPEYDNKIHAQITNADQISDTLLHIAESNDVEYRRFDTCYFCRDPLFFMNYGHLNTNGAMLYTSVLAHDLRDVIQKSISKESKGQ